uniref:Uncharacterized protein n=1 Tax=Picea glauca TaxID=3330 RepID=A0A101LXT2_PICGL|nr:hypothetical protein ABT39_MTgene5475 [Picea glauca]
MRAPITHLIPAPTRFFNPPSFLSLLDSSGISFSSILLLLPCVHCFSSQLHELPLFQPFPHAQGVYAAIASLCKIINPFSQRSIFTHNGISSRYLPLGPSVNFRSVQLKELL